ncbi:amidohydrolase [Limnohabitans sp. TS-CS-82]|uniref:amidohydrolase family protein n=1 Tax=Limnohabitans sp. TS-CS-82 TaxID=2094193 RepID=UPI000CF1C98F|nr:amidohydrolase family protein [Limnohabitans sp. TS-CS-82]PQA83124.1 amidohydrolase [Limnohabitans sp. TS-CS-82]
MQAAQSCSCGIDVHAHVIPGEFPKYLGHVVPSGWPSMAPAHECHRHVMIDGKNYRTVSDKCWTTSRRLADFPDMGLSLQAISPMPELLSYWMQPADGAQLVRFLNEQIATMVHESGGQLVGMGAVPLQDVALAIDELHYMKSALGLQGVEIGSNINGVVMGDPKFDPFFEACVALDMPVFVHALRPTGMDRLLGPAPLQQVLAYPTDVGLAAASVLTGNLLTRYPTLRLAFSHGGGTLAMLLPRLQQAMSVFPALKDSVLRPPTEQARELYYDTLVFDAPTLRHLVQTFGASQLMMGTDYPFNFHDHQPVARIQDAGFDAAVVDQLTHANARRFFGLAA